MQAPLLTHSASTADPRGLDPVPRSAYIHIPFCRRRCYYCDFPISVLGDRRRGENSGMVADYVEILCQEILTAPREGEPLQTVFFGGGTPSLLSVSQLEQILATLDQQFGIDAIAEISMEMDPGTFDLAHIQGYRAAGVNRVSLGVQAFQAELLQACGRSHQVDDIYTAVDLLHQAQVQNFSLDLISGLPHQTIDQWQDSLWKAIALAPQHISVYDLTVEPMTAFGKQYQPGMKPLPTDELTTEMYRLAQRSLTAAGYQHYEISNYAQAGYQCRHNRVYWQNQPYYGFGMGAASYTRRQRFSRPRTRREYAQWVQDYQAAQGQIAEPITPDAEVLLDTLMLGLRLAEGIDLAQLQQRFGWATVSRAIACLQPYIQRGWVQLTPKDLEPVAPTSHLGTGFEQHFEGHLYLTDPEGFLFSNTLLAALFAEFS